MLQEKKMEPRLGPLDIVLYAAILCIHYPLRIAFATYRLIKATIVKAVSVPRQFLNYTILLLTGTEETLEKKLIDILNLLSTLPSYILGKLQSTSNLQNKTEGTNNELNQSTKKDNFETYLEIILSFKQKLSDIVYKLLVTIINIWGQLILFPLKLALFPLKVAKNVITTVLNFPDPQESTMEKKVNQSVFERIYNFFFIILRKVQFYLILIITKIEKLVYQLSELIRTTPRHLFDAIKQIYIRVLQAVALSMIFIYNLARYGLLYVIYYINIVMQKIKGKQPTEPTMQMQTASSLSSSPRDLQSLIKENSKLKDALTRSQRKNENHKCEQQIKDLQNQLRDVQLSFDKERQQYKRDIDKLKQELNQNNSEKLNEFNGERVKLQSEIKKLQNLIAEVQKENEQESRIKKQEAIDLDNERNQLQEQIQTLQLQVVSLQKQNETNALSYSENSQQMKVSFNAEREELQQEIQNLQNKIAELEEAQNKGKNNDRDHQVNDENEELSMKNNIDSVNKTKKKRVTTAY